MSSTAQVLEVWGDFACFTRPEMKVERFSYPCITPSAARGIFDAIYVKPAEFRWQISRIEVLSVPRFIGLRRNEVKDRVSVKAALRWMEGKELPEPLWADGNSESLGTDTKGRTQRQTMALKDVRYRLSGEIRPWPGYGGQQAGFEAQFRRRASRGKCFHQPCFGCREFPAFFEMIEAAPSDSTRSMPVPVDVDLGLMLYDVFDLSRPGASHDAPSVSLFKANIRGGVLEVPDYASPAVLKPNETGGSYA